MRAFSILLLSGALFAAAPGAAKPSVETEQPGDPAGEEELLVQLRAAVGAMREEMFRPGPLVEGWNVGGADPDAELRAAGADRHAYLLEAEDGERSVVLLSDRRIADFAPAGWQVVDSYGSAADAVERPFVHFSYLSPRYVIATRANGFRRDDIDCTDRIAHALLYELPGETMTEEDEHAQMAFRLGLLAIEGVTACTRYTGNRAEGWSARPLLPDGRSLPALELPAERLRIVPLAPVDELMRRPPGETS
ncbi:MAG TPA: hypothetical protein VGB08_06445 [Allosphingosinicella sp.]|jgi:hypothetical protein